MKTLLLLLVLILPDPKTITPDLAKTLAGMASDAQYRLNLDKDVYLTLSNGQYSGIEPEQLIELLKTAGDDRKVLQAISTELLRTGSFDDIGKLNGCDLSKLALQRMTRTRAEIKESREKMREKAFGVYLDGVQELVDADIRAACGKYFAPKRLTSGFLTENINALLFNLHYPYMVKSAPLVVELRLTVGQRQKLDELVKTIKPPEWMRSGLKSDSEEDIKLAVEVAVKTHDAMLASVDALLTPEQAKRAKEIYIQDLVWQLEIHGLKRALREPVEYYPLKMFETSSIPDMVHRFDWATYVKENLELLIKEVGVERAKFIVGDIRVKANIGREPTEAEKKQVAEFESMFAEMLSSGPPKRTLAR